MPSVLDSLIARGAAPLHVPILQPAEPFLELAGEELRRRVFLAEDERGRTRCLRPELTIPAARVHIASGAAGPVRYALAGTVFRQRGPGEVDEFPQAGIETIGGSEADMPSEDARALADAVALVDALAPGRRASVVVGNRAIYANGLDAIGLSLAWRARLSRVHGEADGVRAALAGLDDVARGTAPEDALGADSLLPPPAHAALERGDRETLAAAIADAVARSRMGKGARGPHEIAARLMDRHVLRDSAPDAAQRQAIERLHALSCPFDALGGALHAGGLDHRGLDPRGMPMTWHGATTDALRREGLDPAALTFEAALGRSLDYYTGLVFEARDADGTVLAAGGRYDRLLTLLGAPAPERAVGFALWLDRLGVNLDGTPRGADR